MDQEIAETVTVVSEVEEMQQMANETVENTNVQIAENQKAVEKAIEELQTLMRIDEMDYKPDKSLIIKCIY